MQLISVLKASAEDLRYHIREIRAVKLFYISTGRNAWWSTWVTRYSEGCIHTTWISARDYCEQRRVQGTVFYITELPALAFIAGEHVLTVTEINTDNILGQFNFEKFRDLTEILPVSTMTLRQIYYVFRPVSPLWPSSYRRKDSALLTFGPAAEHLNVCSENDAITAKASMAVGLGYSLRWSERPFDTKFSTVISLANILAKSLTSLPKFSIRRIPAKILKV